MKTLFKIAALGAVIAVPVGAAPPKADPQMQAVLDQLKALKPKPIEKLPPSVARQQPLPGDAVLALLKKTGKGIKPQPVGSVQDTTVPGPMGMVPVRVYKPQGQGPFPVVVYIHGGGWVIASIQDYDASARALCNGAKAMVVSVGYHYAPEHKFPAAHEESYAVTQWVMKNATSWNGDPRRVAIAGESAGGNMATAVCMMARDRKGAMPIHQVLVYPVAQIGMVTPSYKQNWNAKPLNVPMLKWFGKHTLKYKSQANNPYLSVLKGNVKSLPPATIILAEIDPLRSEGEMYAAKLQKAGVPVSLMLYKGVTHEFFGTSAVVDKARNAQDFAAGQLIKAFSR